MERAWPIRGARQGMTVAERFWEKVEKTPGCWIWQGARNRQGYGVIQVGGKAVRANRLIFDLIGDPLGPDEWALHRCDNPPCVRPDHLFRGDRGENAADMAAKGRAAHRPITTEHRARLVAAKRAWQDAHRRTECAKGHAYTPENTAYMPNGKRRCRTCGRANLRASEQRRLLDPERLAHRLAKQREYAARYNAKRRG